VRDCNKYDALAESHSGHGSIENIFIALARNELQPLNPEPITNGWATILSNTWLRMNKLYFIL
jgi:hypothetical protein